MIFRAELSRTFRRSLLVAIPVATIIGGTALVYAGLTTFSAGQQVSSSAINANFASLQAQITALQPAAGDGGTTSATSLQMITATVSAAGGGVTTTACPSGYTLVMMSVANVQLSASGTGGWANGTYGCSNSNGSLQASLTNYTGGSPQSTFSCVGLCAK